MLCDCDVHTVCGVLDGMTAMTEMSLVFMAALLTVLSVTFMTP